MFNYFYSNRRPNAPDIVYKPTTAGVEYADGDALALEDGALVKVAGDVKPTYIAAGVYLAPASEPKPMPVYPVLEGDVYRTTFSADGTALNEGAGVTIETDSAQVTATEGTAAVIERKLGTGAAGTDVLVKF